MAKSIRTIPPKIRSLTDGTKIKCSVGKNYSAEEIQQGALSSLGIAIKNGNLVLPQEPVLPKVIGRFTSRNSEGYEVKRKDLPKETVYHSHDIRIKDWHGNPHDVTVNVPYQRYPRQKFPGDKIKVTVKLISVNNQVYELKFDFDQAIEKGSPQWDKKMILLCNLSLEIFGMFDLVDAASNTSLLKLQRVNWRILPPGEYPFEKIKDELLKQIHKTKVGEAGFDVKRLDFIEQQKPDFRAIGEEEFAGYVVFGFLKNSRFVLDNSRI